MMENACSNKDLILLTYIIFNPFYEEADSSINTGLIFTTAPVSVTHDACHVPLL